MFLRFLIKHPFFLYGISEDHMTLTAQFPYCGFNIMIRFYGGDVTRVSKPGPLMDWCRNTRGLEATLEGGKVSKFSSKDSKGDLHKLLILVTQRVLRVIRNVAIEPDVPETLPTPEATEEELMKWEPELSADNHTWESCTRFLKILMNG